MSPSRCKCPPATCLLVASQFKHIHFLSFSLKHELPDVHVTRVPTGRNRDFKQGVGSRSRHGSSIAKGEQRVVS